MKKQTKQEQRLIDENIRLKEQINQVHKITNPTVTKRKILHLPKKVSK